VVLGAWLRADHPGSPRITHESPPNWVPDHLQITPNYKQIVTELIVKLSDYDPVGMILHLHAQGQATCKWSPTVYSTPCFECYMLCPSWFFIPSRAVIFRYTLYVLFCMRACLCASHIPCSRFLSKLLRDLSRKKIWGVVKTFVTGVRNFFFAHRCVKIYSGNKLRLRRFRQTQYEPLK